MDSSIWKSREKMTVEDAIVHINNHGRLDNSNSDDREAVQLLIDTVSWYLNQDLIKRNASL